MNWASSDDEPRLPRRSRRWLWAIGMAAVGVMATIVLFRLVFPNRVASQLAAIRARGEPVTSAEMAAFYAYPPATEDATQLWLAAARQLEAKAPKVQSQKLPYIDDGAEPALPPQPWDQLDAAQQLLADRAEEMQQLYAAAKLGGRARMPVDFSAGFNTLLPDVQRMRGCARWLALEANVRAHAGDARGTAESLGAGLVLSRALENEPLLVSQLVRIGAYGLAARQLLRLLPAVDFSDDDLAQLQKTLETLEFHSALGHSMAGERAMGLTAFENPASAGLPTAIKYYGMVSGGSDESHYLEFMAEYIAAGELPWPQLVMEFDILTKTVPGRLGRFDILTRMIMPTAGMFWKAFARAETITRLEILAVAAERYRRRTSHPPPDLVALVPEYLAKLPEDPTSGQPYSYRATDSEYVIYSPTQLFDIERGEQADAETSANPLLLFRWSAQPKQAQEEKSGETLAPRIPSAPR